MNLKDRLQVPLVVCDIDCELERLSQVIDRHRFADQEAGEEEAALFPKADELFARGIDVALLVVMLEAGLVSATQLSKVLAQSSADEFNSGLLGLRDLAIALSDHEGPLFPSREPFAVVAPFDPNVLEECFLLLAPRGAPRHPVERLGDIELWGSAFK